eukprot:symbB.v1.2.009192.t1/scaffold581.1/size274127/6
MWRGFSWLLALLRCTTGALVPGLYTISGNVSPWWFGGHLLILSEEDNVTGTAGSVLFAYDHDSDCIIPGCEWRSIYRADVRSSSWEFSGVTGTSGSICWIAFLMPVLGGLWHFDIVHRWHWWIFSFCIVLAAADVVSTQNGNVAAEAGSYEAMVSVVKQNLEMKIPHQGEARAEIEVLEDGRVRGRLRTWFTTNFVNVLLGGTVESSQVFNDSAPAFYQDMGPLFQDAAGNNFSLPSEQLLGYGIPGNLDHMYPMVDGQCHPEEENGPKLAYNVGDFVVPVVCLRYASGGLILKALQDNEKVSTIHSWSASTDCSTGPSGGTAVEDYPYSEYKLANGCAPWTSSNASACPEIQLAECFAEHMASVSWLLVILVHSILAKDGEVLRPTLSKILKADVGIIHLEQTAGERFTGGTSTPVWKLRFVAKRGDKEKETYLVAKWVKPTTELRRASYLNEKQFYVSAAPGLRKVCRLPHMLMCDESPGDGLCFLFDDLTVDFPLHPEGLDLPGAHASLKWLVRPPFTPTFGKLMLLVPPFRRALQR